jgi:ethanolamine utilization cobalamin adenosyltransferase
VTHEFAVEGCDNDMSLITESELRKQYRARSLTDGTVYEVSPGTILTPLAKSFLSDHKIDLHWVKTLDEEQVNVNEPVNEPVVASVVASASNDKLQRTTNLDVDPTLGGKKRFRTLYGGFLETKPEHMTHLYGNMLVFKDHPRIVFRGKLDSLEQ